MSWIVNNCVTRWITKQVLDMAFGPEDDYDYRSSTDPGLPPS